VAARYLPTICRDASLLYPYRYEAAVFVLLAWQCPHLGLDRSNSDDISFVMRFVRMQNAGIAFEFVEGAAGLIQETTICQLNGPRCRDNPYKASNAGKSLFACVPGLLPLFAMLRFRMIK